MKADKYSCPRFHLDIGYIYIPSLIEFCQYSEYYYITRVHNLIKNWKTVNNAEKDRLMCSLTFFN
jgi:hypothetical protein